MYDTLENQQTNPHHETLKGVADAAAPSQLDGNANAGPLPEKTEMEA